MFRVSLLCFFCCFLPCSALSVFSVDVLLFCFASLRPASIFDKRGTKPERAEESKNSPENPGLLENDCDECDPKIPRDTPSNPKTILHCSISYTGKKPSLPWRDSQLADPVLKMKAEYTKEHLYTIWPKKLTTHSLTKNLCYDRSGILFPTN